METIVELICKNTDFKVNSLLKEMDMICELNDDSTLERSPIVMRWCKE
jgi:hypothetical protein